MEQNREPIKKPMPLWSISITKEARAYDGIKTVSSINSVGRTGLVQAKKNDTNPPTYTIHQNKLKINKRLKYQL